MEHQLLKQSVMIHAKREKVWNVLLDDRTYRIWTSVFAEGSYAETDWKQGSKALFMNSEGEGMVSRVAESIPYEKISLEHLGFVKNGVEDYESEQVKKWAGARETYLLKEKDGGTELLIVQDMPEEHMQEFGKMWEKALQKVKQLAEENA